MSVVATGAHHDESVSEPLHAESHGAMTHVASSGLLNRVEVDVDHSVQVSSHYLGHLGRIQKINKTE